MIKKLEVVLIKSHFDLVIVYGDTNSTFAGALSANRLDTKVAHVESGLRSFDRRMPEEINRILTDQLGDYLFAPTRIALKNLEREHVYGKVVYTGDVSVELVKKAAVLAAKSYVLADNALERKSYMVCTIHRAENADSRENLISVIRAFRQLPEIKIVFPIHPRTVRMLEEYNLLAELQKCKNVKIMPPVGYVDFIRLLKDASKVITDSGGVQKEAYLLSVPCITIRRNTEWLETVRAGWNILTDMVTEKIVHASRRWEPSMRAKPIFGDGKTSARIGRFIKNAL
jgi:UDP-N-acetylglucosamine 2-epimerase (non-hydrolysing)